VNVELVCAKYKSLGMATAGESYRASSGSVVASNGDLFWSAAPITMRACFEVWITKGGSGDEIGARSHFGGWYLGRGVDRRADGVCVGCRALQHFACQRLSEPGVDGRGGLRLPILHFRMGGPDRLSHRDLRAGKRNRLVLRLPRRKRRDVSTMVGSLPLHPTGKFLGLFERDERRA